MHRGKRTTAVCLAAILIFAMCFGLADAPNDDVTSVASGLPNDLDAYIADEFEKSHIPGMSFEIVSKDAVLLGRAYGEAKSCDEPFILGSLSKSFTAVAILQLEEAGLLSLDAPVAGYLPEFDQNSKTTVRQLLNHTSGIKTSATLGNYRSSDAVAAYTYSNLNYNLLGMIVETLSGMNYGEYITQRIFEPIGMEHTYTSLEEAKANGLIDGNRNYFGLYVHQAMPYPADLVSDWMSLSSAYIISTANDMGRYMMWYLSGSNADVLSAESRERMFSETIVAATDYEYGLGWGINYKDGKVFYLHGGVVENYTSYLVMIPDQGIGIIALTNSCDFLVADAYTISIPTNAAYKIAGLDTSDIGKNDYVKSHLLYDLGMLALLAFCALPVFLFRRWRKRKHNAIASAVFIAAVHVALPTLLLMLSGILLDRPLYVVYRFAPDVFIILCAGALFLYGTGIAKAICLIQRKTRRTDDKQEATS